MAGVITKTSNGNKYDYYEYFEGGKTHQIYCGTSGSKKSKTKALKTEYEQLEKKYKSVTTRMKQIKKELVKLK